MLRIINESLFIITYFKSDEIIAYEFVIDIDLYIMTNPYYHQEKYFLPTSAICPTFECHIWNCVGIQKVLYNLFYLCRRIIRFQILHLLNAKVVRQGRITFVSSDLHRSVAWQQKNTFFLFWINKFKHWITVYSKRACTACVLFQYQLVFSNILGPARGIEFILQLFISLFKTDTMIWYILVIKVVSWSYLMPQWFQYHWWSLSFDFQI